MTKINKLLTFFLLMIFPIIGQAQSKLRKDIEYVIRNKKAQVGVAVIDQKGDTFTVNNGKHYPMMSVMKFHEALALLNQMNETRTSLNKKIHIVSKELSAETYSPMYKKYGNSKAFSLPIKEVLKYAISYSDNNACDVLFKYIGGPITANYYIHKLGWKDISIRVNEQMMYANRKTVYDNWSTPLASAEVLRFFLINNLFDKTYKDYLIQIMKDTNTGTDKLKGLLPKDIIMGHKTGSAGREESGNKAGDNDLGFVYLPNGQFYTIAVFVKDSMESDKTNAQIIAQISKLVYDYEIAKIDHK